MKSRASRISLLSEMIEFAIVDGQLHDKEYDFLYLLSKELEIENQLLWIYLEKEIHFYQ